MKSSNHFGKVFASILVLVFIWGSLYTAKQSLNFNKIFNGSSIIQKANLFEFKKYTDQTSQDIVIEKKDTNEVIVMIGGDIMFDRSIRSIGMKKGYDTLFDKSITDLFKKADIVSINLEGPITSHPSKTFINNAFTKSLVFTFATTTTQTLGRIGVDIVSLANNHTDNFGINGYNETQTWLNKAGIKYFGNPWNGLESNLRLENKSNKDNKTVVTDSPITTIITKNGVNIAFIGYHAFQTGIDRVISEIKRVENENIFTIVIPHWGEEYTKIPSERLKNQARAFVDAGTDAVIGAHPHVIMNNEYIDGIPIYYSIGNLLFDQYFSSDVMKGNIIELHIVKKDNRVSLANISIHDIKIKPQGGVSLELSSTTMPY